MSNSPKRIYIVLLILALIVNFVGLNAGFFTDDPGLYASIAKNIVQKNDLLQLFTYNTDWLDKPHFPFWMAALSFKVFGTSAWAYRLPALLFFCLSLLYTWLFARKYYGKDTAFIAVLILATAEHIIISNIDTRAEPYLMALVIGSIYHISQYKDKGTLKHFILAALLTACAIMTKGLFVVVAIYGALLGQMIAEKQFLKLFSGKWLLLYVCTVVFTLPEFYALYVQFDLYPKKLVFGRYNVSGIRWFLWDSQFGRFANNGPIHQKKSGDPFFFLHTMLWTFLPWCLMFYFAVYKNVAKMIRKVGLPEYYTFAGGMLLLLLFSLSRFQLPFYTNILFPLFAILMAPYMLSALTRSEERLRNAFLLIFAVALPLTIIAVHILLRPASSLLFIADVMAFGGLVIWLIKQQIPSALKVFACTCCAALFGNFYMNTVFFPKMASYNSQIQAANFVNKPIFANANIYSLRQSNNSFQFYCKKPVNYIGLEDFGKFSPKGKSIFYASQASLDQLRNESAQFTIIATFVDYPQENILPKFINYKTRQQVLSKAYLITK
ncbi:glycosyl transferase [Mucilaginibacter achroorhodeus]|uniref:Glycosyl transferase n=1 Tax=Mucilaginibacter achroorhodeus TaxID=2599294 RepID=A0A563UA72_9SPHI|nr:glycosyltransferase family 39 protein [Mucilaginibacter achroorhodeus]TWR28291.1 glycosyl transferase [Mucilaginibacter achroorhodeus]